MKLLLAICIFLASCVGLNKNDSKTNLNVDKKINSHDIAQFQKALKGINRGHYATSQLIFKNLATRYRGQDLEWASLYNLASIYKKTGKCHKAETIYQKLLKTNHKILKPTLYLLLSYVYECQGKFKQTLSILKQGLPIIYQLPEKTQRIEYPARLFLAYIRMGQISSGRRIQKQVLDNMDQIKKTSPIDDATEKVFSEYWYLMGRSHIQPHHIRLKNFLTMAWYYQLYLTQSIFLKKGKWSIASEKELKNIYKKIRIQLKKGTHQSIYKKEVQFLLDSLYKTLYSDSNQKFKHLYHLLSQLLLED